MNKNLIKQTNYKPAQLENHPPKGPTAIEQTRKHKPLHISPLANKAENYNKETAKIRNFKLNSADSKSASAEYLLLSSGTSPSPSP
jgi:hypothetical protein